MNRARLNHFLKTAGFAAAVLALVSPAAQAGPGREAAGQNNSALIVRSDKAALTIGGFLQLWWLLQEGADNELREPISNDRAAQHSSGFCFRRARLTADLETYRFSASLSVKLETDSPALGDAYVTFPLRGERLRLRLGQMKVPTTYEVAVSAQGLDFLNRSWFSTKVVDYSLSRSPAGGNPEFIDARMANRDIGLALTGKLGSRRLGGDYFAMVGNGFGANRFTGGKSNPQAIYGNEFGSYLYALRVSFGGSARPPADAGAKPPAAVRIGGHVSYNTHPNIVLDDRETVLDIERLAWSGDLRLDLLGVLKLTGMYGQIFVEDDVDNDGRTDYAVTGWELKGVVDIYPNTLQAGLRYDAFGEERFENGLQHRLDSFTAGFSYFTPPKIKLQLNYTWNILDSSLYPDLDDNFLAAFAQVSF